MTSANKAKGARWELDIVRYLAAVFGRKVRRPHAEGFEDVGDIHVSPFCLQAKNYADVGTALRVGVAGAELQAARAEEKYGVAVIKRRGKGAADAYVAMSLAAFRDLVEEYHALAEDAWKYRELSR
ncbi:hypothetical protein HPO96_37085 [Kribbella sandramycini]|uniref:Holliday junction resolvase n=1 Tax=Kribbella sandramycini TaxID=60450 RepID=A0A7Y4P574_9ACTN|nr:hypothetical protein [Kribbella sandramycini]MBB6564414.1 hypothetical protein [Kribbella sandramycini]NOL45875.1 hypothetical protein [Kribbella sandramycini]